MVVLTPRPSVGRGRGLDGRPRRWSRPAAAAGFSAAALPAAAVSAAPRRPAPAASAAGSGGSSAAGSAAPRRPAPAAPRRPAPRPSAAGSRGAAPASSSPSAGMPDWGQPALALDDRVRERAQDQVARANGVVVGDDVGRLVGVAVRVHEADHREAEAIRLAHADRLLLRSTITTASGNRCMSATPPRLVSSLASSPSRASRSRVGSRSSWPSCFWLRSSCRRRMR